MRLARFDGGRLGVVVGEDIADITGLVGGDPQQWPDMTMVRLIRDFDHVRGDIEGALAGLPRKPLAQVRLETPVPWPNKIIAYPVNYHAHGREMQAQYRATNQGFFLKPNSALSGPADPIMLPAVPGREVHHESELAIIIGKECRGVAREDWQDVVFGYACLLDMVVRGREERVFRKAYDTFCPVGPWITTADEVTDPAALDMKLWVNGDLRQSANTRDLVLDIPGMVATASAVMTLYPGDIIATGTPEGVGPVVDGDRIRIVIDQVGEMAVDVVQGNQGMTEVFAQPYVPPIVKQS
ncbi:MAG: fumarylacetoacetate hydrolase family protein [Alphaproteobacteria bacterium]|nr:fumarylacetoacetate hydrolase family protein [Alphaproteobacteria bacterium]MBU0793539.1 fumarylacetoacetate hydrolase family protein [Alphaproteobacteria bacterium]MBU0876389.1 fumarylacetoacetate hydrolase family protein [Alphaproteobacteria bacterium]MBU1770954.1 fumarylacetoacetate hydrolase family protein [Alphaproteobacteria bacterium]